LFRLCDNKVIIYNNNVVVVASLNKSFIRDNSIISLRDIAIFLIFNNILIKTISIDFKLNNCIDLFSRDKYETIVNKYLQLVYFNEQILATL